MPNNNADYQIIDDFLGSINDIGDRFLKNESNGIIDTVRGIIQNNEHIHVPVKNSDFLHKVPPVNYLVENIFSYKCSAKKARNIFSYLLTLDNLGVFLKKSGTQQRGILHILLANFYDKPCLCKAILNLLVQKVPECITQKDIDDCTPLIIFFKIKTTFLLVDSKRNATAAHDIINKLSSTIAQPDNRGNTPLHYMWTVYEEYQEKHLITDCMQSVCEIFIQVLNEYDKTLKSNSFHILNKEGQTPLLFIFSSLVKYANDKDSQSHDMSNKFLDYWYAFLEPVRNKLNFRQVDNANRTILHLILEGQGNEDLYKIYRVVVGEDDQKWHLLQRNKEGQTAALYAAYNNQSQEAIDHIVEETCKSGSTESIEGIDEKGNSILFYAIKYRKSIDKIAQAFENDVLVADYLTRANHSGETPFLIAVRNKDEHSIQLCENYIQKTGVNIRTVVSFECVEAVQANRAKDLDILFEKFGTQITQQEKNGLLNIAFSVGKIESANSLTKQGASLYREDYQKLADEMVMHNDYTFKTLLETVLSNAGTLQSKYMRGDCFEVKDLSDTSDELIYTGYTL